MYRLLERTPSDNCNEGVFVIAVCNIQLEMNTCRYPNQTPEIVNAFIGQTDAQQFTEGTFEAPLRNNCMCQKYQQLLNAQQ